MSGVWRRCAPPHQTPQKLWWWFFSFSISVLVCYTKQAMKFLRPIIKKAQQSSSSLFTRVRSTSPAPSSFGEKRAQEMNQRLQKAQEERKKLVRAEFSSQGQTKDMIEQKRLQTDRRISRLSAQQKDDNQ